jgi:hypothetical protein
MQSFCCRCCPSSAAANNLVAVLDGYFIKGGHHINVNVLNRCGSARVNVCIVLCCDVSLHIMLSVRRLCCTGCALSHMHNCLHIVIWLWILYTQAITGADTELVLLLLLVLPFLE